MHRAFTCLAWAKVYKRWHRLLLREPAIPGGMKQRRQEGECRAWERVVTLGIPHTQVWEMRSPCAPSWRTGCRCKCQTASHLTFPRWGRHRDGSRGLLHAASSGQRGMHIHTYILTQEEAKNSSSNEDIWWKTCGLTTKADRFPPSVITLNR